MNQRIEDLAQKSLKKQPLNQEEILFLLGLRERQDQEDLLYWADRIRRTLVGDKVHCCGIVNARSGACPEDCAYCAQSGHHQGGAEVYPFLDRESILKAAKEAKAAGAEEFGIVTSGYGLSDADCDLVEELLPEINKLGLRADATLGVLSAERIARLKKAGLKCYNHNLETSRAHFAKICTTHRYEDRLNMVRRLQEAGVRVCCGGIFGMGETEADIADFAMELRDLKVPGIPLNFLHPIAGTPLGHLKPLKPGRILQIIAVFRFVCFDRVLRVCGGRDKNLRDLQSHIFRAGANGIMVGNYLTTAGRNPETDLKMLEDLEMEGAFSPPE